MKGKRKRRRLWLAALAAAEAIALAAFFALPWALIGSAETTPAEVILHCAIDPHSDSDAYVVALYRQGTARKIVCVSSQISWEVYPADYARNHLISLGVPPEDVLTLHLPLADCWGESVPGIVAYVKQQGWRSALMVASPVNSRIGARVAQRGFAREQIGFAVTYSPRDKEELTNQWWRTHWKAQQIIGNALTTALDLFYPQCW